jgi:hypothetical protein
MLLIVMLSVVLLGVTSFIVMLECYYAKRRGVTDREADWTKA